MTIAYDTEQMYSKDRLALETSTWLGRLGEVPNIVLEESKMKIVFDYMELKCCEGAEECTPFEDDDYQTALDAWSDSFYKPSKKDKASSAIALAKSIRIFFVFSFLLSFFM